MVVSAGTGWAAPVPADRACAAAADIESAAFQLPPGLLGAIGLVESGRAARDADDPMRVRRRAWPFTVDVDGVGRWFGSAAEAVAFVRGALVDGARSVDVGCFQIDLEDHPGAFARLAQAFDPLANAAYAAGFLTRLHRRLGSWPAAIAFYHSADPARGGPYGALVQAAWSQSAGVGASRAAGGMRGGADRHVIRLGPVRGGLPVIVTP